MPLSNPLKTGLVALELQERIESLLLRKGRGQRVLIVPGFPGCHIGRRSAEVVWFNLARLIQGGLADLSLDKPNQHEALGALLSFYLPTALALDRAGFDVDFHFFDWRLSIKELGAELKARLGKSDQEVNLVAHSMGGLVVRSAVAQGAPKIRRVVMLGTPNFGTLASVQALRGTSPLLVALALIDIPHTADDLALVCRSFPGLYHMMPSQPKFQPLLKLTGWPRHGPAPNPAILAGVEEVYQLLATAQNDPRFFIIAGANQRTAFDVRLQNDEFVYDFSREGDGLVPLDWVELPGVETYYVESSHHMFLADNLDVANATADLLNHGDTKRLPDRRPKPLAGGGSVTDSELQTAAGAAHEFGILALSEVRNVLVHWTTVPPGIE